MLLLLAGTPVVAQDESYGPALESPADAEATMASAREYWSTAPRERPSECAEPDPDPDTIVVCREWEDGERYTFEREPDRRVGADMRDMADGTPRAPDFDESCLHTRGRANCTMLGRVPPPAIVTDFESLPETPPDSEAARLYGGPTADDAVAEGEEP
ncbi:MAG: hypothetical protein ABIT10_10520 [Alteraurantiacibacter sp.]